VITTSAHVADDAHVDRVAAEAREHPVQRVAVAVVDLACGQRRADRLQLVAGREVGDAEPPVDAYLADADRSQHPELRRLHALPRAEHDLSPLQVLTREATVGPRRRDRVRRDPHALALDAGAFLHHDGVRARRHHAAREDAQALPGPDGRRRRFSGEGFADADEHGLPAGGEVGEAHGVAVHRRVVVAWHVDRRDDVLREDAVERLPQVDPLGRGDRRQERADQRARLVDRHRVRVVVVGAGGFAQGLG
jgi:hypothetical protein